MVDEEGLTALAHREVRRLSEGVSCVGFPLMIASRACHRIPLALDSTPPSRTAMWPARHAKMGSQMQRALRIVHHVEDANRSNQV